MCYTGKCPYESGIDGECTIKNRDELKDLCDAGCNAPEVYTISKPTAEDFKDGNK